MRFTVKYLQPCFQSEEEKEEGEEFISAKIGEGGRGKSWECNLAKVLPPFDLFAGIKRNILFKTRKT